MESSYFCLIEIQKKPNLLGKCILNLETKKGHVQWDQIQFWNGESQFQIKEKKKKSCFDIWSSFVHKTGNLEELFHCTT